MGIYISQSQDTTGTENSTIKTNSTTNIKTLSNNTTMYSSSLLLLLISSFIGVFFYYKK